MSPSHALKPHERAIALFDSGVGGLTVLSALQKRLPQEHFIYLGDTARVPYGSKSPETVTRYAVELVQELMKSPLKMVIIACNTASAVSLSALIHQLDPTGAIPVLGTIGPSAHAALHTVRGIEDPRIGIIGTTGTIQGQAYQRVLKNLYPDLEIEGKPCPLFVPLIEEGWLDGPIAKLTVERYLTPLKAWAPHTLILGCTHYPLLRTQIQAFMGEKTHLIDSADPTANEAEALLRSRGLLRAPGTQGSTTYYVTDGPEKFKDIAQEFLQETVDDVHLMSVPTGKRHS